jgi:chemotaxis protein histidine kinase CheA/ActR/RegA family two-component response regulator
VTRAFRPDDELRRELLQLFAAESRDEVEVISSGLVALESDAAGAIGAGRTDEMMRAAHSLKGGARAVELESVDRLAHALEGLLKAAGDRGAFDGETVDLAYRALDGIEGIIAAATGGPPAEVNVTGLTDELQTAITGLPGERPAPTEPSPRSAAPAPAPAPEALPEPTGPSPLGQPDATVRVRVSKLDGLMAAVRELEAARVGVEHATGILTERAEADDLKAREYDVRAGNIRETTAAPLTRLERAAREVAGEVSEARTVPLSLAFDPLPRTVRDLGRDLGREVELTTSGGEVDVDRAVMEVLRPALVHVIRNAIDHGIESPAARAAGGKDEKGRVTVTGRTSAGLLEIEVADDGAGIDADAIRRSAISRELITAEEADALPYAELIEFVTRPGFSTRDKVTEISGRGVGLDAVNEGLGSIQGTLGITSIPGSGSKVTMTVPLAIAATEVIVAELGGLPIGISLSDAARIVALEGPSDETIEVDGAPVPFCSDTTLEALAPHGRGEATCAIAVEVGGRRIALPVERLRTVQRLSTMPLPEPLPRVSLIRSAAILPDGDVLRVIEVRTLIEDLPPPPVVLIADDSAAWLERARRHLANHGWRVETAPDGRVALAMLGEGNFDALLTDVEMPGHDGIELTDMVRKDSELADIRVVVWSASAEDAGPAALAAGADAFLIKEPGAEDDAAAALRPDDPED